MRNVSRSSRLMILAASIALAIAGCARSSAVEPAQAGPAVHGAAVQTAPVAVQTEAALTCQPPFHLCIGCTSTPICALHCPECPPPAAPAEAALTCPPPLHLCPPCGNGGTQICASHCPDCPVLAAPPSEPAPAILAFSPVGQACGGATCTPGTSCCNPSCGICTPKGVNCTQQTCD